MEADPKVVVMGEDVGRLGGVFRVTDGLQKDFGEHRVLDTPLAESGIIGTAVGLAMRGYRPVLRDPVRRLRLPRLRPDRLPARQAALPLAGRAADAGGRSGSRSAAGSAPSSTTRESRSRFRALAGLQVVACANPPDAYWMIQQAIACDDPVIFFEPKRRYWEKGELADDGARRCSARGWCAPATTAALAGYGPMVRTCLDAAAAAEEDGQSSR